MIDIDRFKRFNDTYGHKTGDLVLIETANRLRTMVRAGEKLCRFGGEEFLIICPNSSADAAQRLAERLRKAVGSRPIKTKGVECSVTISLGVAERTGNMTASDDLLAATDAALYGAKRAGRDRVHVAGARDPSPVGSM
jgi:diguanylate cyclase (GGDEF)-like protein